MSKKLFENQKGISNLIATLILIAIAIVGGAFAYTVFRNQAQTTTTSADLQVQDLSAVKVSDNLYVSVTLKNTGSQQLSNILVTIDPDPGWNVNLDLWEYNVDPGATISASKTKGDILNAGQTYAVRITADTPAGTITKTTTVRVKS